MVLEKEVRLDLLGTLPSWPPPGEVVSKRGEMFVHDAAKPGNTYTFLHCKFGQNKTITTPSITRPQFYVKILEKYTIRYSSANIWKNEEVLLLIWRVTTLFHNHYFTRSSRQNFAIFLSGYIEIVIKRPNSLIPRNFACSHLQVAKTDIPCE